MKKMIVWINKEDTELFKFVFNLFVTDNAIIITMDKGAFTKITCNFSKKIDLSVAFSFGQSFMALKMKR